MTARQRGVVVVGIGLLYATGLNPYYLPDTYDNVLYHGAARSIADGEGYRFGGEVVTDWPPLFPAVLALPHALGWHGVLAAKVAVLALALAGLALAWRLARAEDRPWPGLVVVGLALAPTGFQMGTRIMAEWPYMVASFAFLLALRRVARQRDVPATLAAGLLLGAAGLTRYTGVFLMAAVAWQAARTIRDRSLPGPAWRRAWPEVGVGAVGAGLWMAWALVLASAAQGPGGAVMEPQNLAASSYGDFHPLAVLRAAANLFLCTESVLGRVPAVGLAVALGGVALGTLGLSIRARRRAIEASDAYALAFLPFLAFYERGEVPTLTRYLLPVGPFLLGWVFEGLREVAGRRTGRLPVPTRLGRVAAAAWLAGLFAVDVGLVAIGKTGGPHGGLSPLASPDPESFYRGRWLDYYRAATFLREQPDLGPVSEVPNSTRYLAVWSGRDLVETRDGAPVDPDRFARVVFVVAPEAWPALPGFEPSARFGSLTVWRRSDGPPRSRPRRGSRREGRDRRFAFGMQICKQDRVRNASGGAGPLRPGPRQSRGDFRTPGVPDGRGGPRRAGSGGGRRGPRGRGGPRG